MASSEPVAPELVRSFLVVAEELSFRRAADRLALDQSALSRRIQRLEAQLGFPLLERTSRRVALTPAGALFRERNARLFRDFDEAVRDARRLASGLTGRLRIGYMAFVAPRLMPRAIARFRTAHPGIALSLSYLPTAAQKRALVHDEVDVGYLIGPFDHEDFETVSLGADPLCLVAARGHPLLSRERLVPADLEGEPMVLGDLASWEAFRQRLDDLFAAEGARLSVALEAPSTLALVGLVANGLGVTVYPASLAGLLGGEVAARPFDGPGLEVETVLARKRVNRTAAVRAFLRLARAVV